jgi:hypothetical protein
VEGWSQKTLEKCLRPVKAVDVVKPCLIKTSEGMLLKSKDFEEVSDLSRYLMCWSHVDVGS